MPSGPRGPEGGHGGRARVAPRPEGRRPPPGRAGRGAALDRGPLAADAGALLRGRVRVVGRRRGEGLLPRGDAGRRRVPLAPPGPRLGGFLPRSHASDAGRARAPFRRGPRRRVGLRVGRRGVRDVRPRGRDLRRRARGGRGEDPGLRRSGDPPRPRPRRRRRRQDPRAAPPQDPLDSPDHRLDLGEARRSGTCGAPWRPRRRAS